MSPRPVTVAVLAYGDHAALARRCIESIHRHCGRDLYRLVVGANSVCAETRSYLEGLRSEGAIDRLLVSETNLNKCPMMRKMVAELETEFLWWFDDDSYVVSPDALPERLRMAEAAPAGTVMWGHVFYYGNENDFSFGTDVAGYVRRARWYRRKEPPSWAAGGKGERDFEGRGGGDGRWFFPTGGCWFIRSSAIRALDWPDPGLIKRNDDVLLAEAIRQQGWEFRDIGACGVAINTEPRRGVGEDRETMEKQMAMGRMGREGEAAGLSMLHHP
jgi:hypothetical protein